MIWLPYYLLTTTYLLFESRPSFQREVDSGTEKVQGTFLSVKVIKNRQDKIKHKMPTSKQRNPIICVLYNSL